MAVHFLRSYEQQWLAIVLNECVVKIVIGDHDDFLFVPIVQ